MREHQLGYRESVRKHWKGSNGKEPNHIKQVQRWERIYLEERTEGFMKESWGRACFVNVKVNYQNLIKVLKEI